MKIEYGKIELSSTLVELIDCSKVINGMKLIFFCCFCYFILELNSHILTPIRYIGSMRKVKSCCINAIN